MPESQFREGDPHDDIIDRMRKRKQKSYVNIALVAVNIVIFAAVEATGGSENPENVIRWGAGSTERILEGEYYRLFTSMFLHFGLRHLLNNMLLLFFIGDYMERFLGRIRYLILYLAGGVLANYFSWRIEVQSGENVLSAGASGAIFALIGGLLVLLIFHRGKMEDLTLPRVLIMAVLSLIVGFETSGVDGFAHLGGFLAGCVITFFYEIIMRKSGSHSV